MSVSIKLQYKVKGETFGARGSSCSCDPCDCNPCNCGSDDSLNPTNYPFWRVSGYYFRAGEIGGVSIAQRLLLSLSQPMRAGITDDWQEVILVDSDATQEQVAALLAGFEEQLDSIPAEVGLLPNRQRAVYQIPMEYCAQGEYPHLHVSFVHDTMLLLRQDPAHLSDYPPEWTYDGAMALRTTFDSE